MVSPVVQNVKPQKTGVPANTGQLAGMAAPSDTPFLLDYSFPPTEFQFTFVL